MDLTSLFDIGSKIIDRVIPDPTAKQAAQLELLKLQQSGDLAQLNADTQLAQGQLDINKVEAANSNLFVSGWRPAIGWVCALALFCYYIPYALVAVSLWAYNCIHTGTLSPHPDIAISDLLGLLGAMLGLGWARTAEKFRGVASK